MAVVTEDHVHEAHTHDGGGSSAILGIILLVVLLLALFYFGLPLLRNATTPPQVNVPGQIDVNVNK